MSIPNYSLELEQRVLETLMHFGHHDSSDVQKAMLKLSADCFYSMDHQALFIMVRDTFNKQQPFGMVDMLMLIPRDNNELFTSLHWIIENYGKYPSGINYLESDVNRLITFSKLRRQIFLSEKMIEEVKNCGNPEDAQDILIRNINEISNLNFRESKAGISSVELAESFYDGTLEKDLILPTTCDQLNEALNGGIMSKSLITVAAGAGVGKTGFAIFLMDAIARNQPGSQSLFYSLEMESKHIWMRHVGICGGKQFEKLDNDEQLNAVAKSLNVPMKIYDSASCRSAADIDFILTNARLTAMQCPVSVIVVDYLGLVENKGKFERNDLKQADVTSKLAKLAMELNCVVIALSQINRGASQRAKDDQCPWPQDAADSSGSHRSSTLWLGVDRPELYQDDFCYKNQFVIKCRKNRFGGTFELILAFNDGTFAEVPQHWFKKPESKPKSMDKALFSAHGKDFYGDQ
jgi:replicative DNA helicase